MPLQSYAVILFGQYPRPKYPYNLGLHTPHTHTYPPARIQNYHPVVDVDLKKINFALRVSLMNDIITGYLYVYCIVVCTDC